MSHLISYRLKELDPYLESGDVRLVFSQELLEEFLEVAARPKFAKYFGTTDVAQLLQRIDLFGDVVEVKTSVNHCRDKKDNFLLSLSIDGSADFLITGDDDVLAIKKVGSTKILSWSEFARLLRK